MSPVGDSGVPLAFHEMEYVFARQSSTIGAENEESYQQRP